MVIHRPGASAPFVPKTGRRRTAPGPQPFGGYKYLKQKRIPDLSTGRGWLYYDY